MRSNGRIFSIKSHLGKKYLTPESPVTVPLALNFTGFPFHS